MQASLFEFRHRWWVFFSIFFAAFFAYSLDPVNCGVAITNWLTKRLGTVANDNSYRLIFAFGTLLLALAAILRTWGFVLAGKGYARLRGPHGKVAG